ncbi:MAG: porin [Rhodobacteraceae bacterium]|nr:porin [Paracoccaceae bacterium]
MKKIFLTSAAALVASGGAFAMDGPSVSISADGNFGVTFAEDRGGGDTEFQFHHEFDVKFAASLTTDDGMVFGGSIKIDQSNGAHDARTFMTIDDHTVTIGDGLDAGDNFGPLGLLDPGFDGIGVDDVGEALRGRTDTDATYEGDYGIVNVRVSVGDADTNTLAASCDAESGDCTGITITGGGDEEFAFGLGIDLAPMTAGLGFDSRGTVSLGGEFTQGLVSAGFLYSVNDDYHDREAGDTRIRGAADVRVPRQTVAGDQEATAFGADATYQFSDTTSINLAAGQYEDKGTSTERRAFGIGFEHNLGGGATLAGGIGSVENNAGKDKARGDFGIAMKF